MSLRELVSNFYVVTFFAIVSSLIVVFMFPMLQRILFILFFVKFFIDIIKWFQFITNEKHSLIQNNFTITSSYLFPNYFQNDSGLWIHYRKWDSLKKQYKSSPKGIIMISHGYAQHINQYSGFAKYLNDNGYIVYGCDHQGHGMSDGDRGYYIDLMDLVNDFLKFTKIVKSNHDNLPIFLFGHSMGGLVAMYCALEKQNEKLYKSVILSSPMLLPGKNEQIKLSPFLEKLANFIDKTFPKLPFIACYNNGLTNNALIKERLINDRLKLNGMMPLRAGKQMKEKGEHMLYKLSKNIQYSFYIFVGSNDKIIDVDACKLFYNNTVTNENNKKINIFNGLLHETLFEKETHTKKVFSEIIEWIDKC